MRKYAKRIRASCIVGHTNLFTRKIKCNPADFTPAEAHLSRQGQSASQGLSSFPLPTFQGRISRGARLPSQVFRGGFLLFRRFRFGH